MIMQYRAIVGATLAFVAAAAFAHHGWDGYDATKTLKLTGQLEAPAYENPHATTTLKTADATWSVVLAPPSRMMSRGLTREMLTAGATATVEGYPHRSNEGELRAERITIDGKTVELR
jgi:Family of unknown function (DUF6152)